MTVRSRTTIADVAKACGVTPATVSRVLNRKASFSTSDAVRERIFETAKKLQYVPDLAARNLNRRSTRIIGIFSAPHTSFTWGINQSLMMGVSQVLHTQGYDVFFEVSSPHKLDHALPFWRFDGAILLQSPKSEIIEELGQRRVPYVCINERLGTPIANVLSDDVMGVTMVMRHLSQYGHKKLAYANAPSMYLPHYSVVERHEAILDQAAARKMEIVAGHDQPFASAERFLEDAVVRGGATAVISYDHTIAVSLVGAAARMKLRIPQDLSLVCFNDEFPAAQIAPALTAVAVGGREMGRIGAQLLVDALQSSTPAPSSVIRVAETLHPRDSSGPAPVR